MTNTQLGKMTELARGIASHRLENSGFDEEETMAVTSLASSCHDIREFNEFFRLIDHLTGRNDQPLLIGHEKHRPIDDLVSGERVLN